MLRPFVFLSGYLRYKADASAAADIAELCRRQRRIYRRFEFSDDRQSVEVDIPLIFARSFARACESENISVEISGRFGLPALIRRYRRRYGIFAGALLFLLLSVFSGSILWDVRVEGNSILSDREVVEILDGCGLSVGMITRGLKTAQIETRALIASEDIAWISINILGSVAEVHIIEDDGATDEDVIGSDIVAERGGEILWLEDIRGYQVVEIGSSVSEGDLLISGRYPQLEGLSQRYTTPRGKVMARTVREETVFIPYRYEKKSYTGQERYQKYFIFFKKEIKFFENCGKMYAECDTIDTVEYFELPQGVRLPFGVRTVRYLEYKRETVRRSDESAVELALYTLRCRIESEAADGMLMKKELHGSFTEEGYTLYCRAEYIEDIARLVPSEE